MARRRKDDGLLDALASLPWPAGLAFGVLGFLFLVGTVLKPFAWIVLVIGLVTAGVSALRAAQRSSLLEAQTGLDSLRAMDWKRFEQLVGEGYRRLGYRIEETGQGGADGGIDILMRKDGATVLVQCKQWKRQQIGVAVVREMYGLMVHHDADAVKIVCSGSFTGECRAFAADKPIELVDGEALLRLVLQVQVSPVQRSVEAPSPPSQPLQASAPAAATPSAPHACPRCAGAMAERTNRATGQRFWGCTSFPKCRGTIAI